MRTSINSSIFYHMAMSGVAFDAEGLHINRDFGIHREVSQDFQYQICRGCIDRSGGGDD